MKNLLILLVVLFAATTLSAQQCVMTTQPQMATKWSKSKDGIVTTKTCLYWYACPNMEVIEFRATATSAVTLYKINDEVYQDLTKKVWDRFIQEDGLVVFKSGNKAFYYTP